MSVYLDYAATTPVDPRVVAKMLPYFKDQFGNAASTHTYGLIAKEAVEDARSKVANLFNADPREIVWTSGATESNNLALKGVSLLYQQKGKHIITLKTEHPSILETCYQLEKQGFEITYLNVETNGLLDLEKLKKAIRPQTILVSIMHVNNETGVIQDIDQIANIVKAHDILFHVDAAQSAGKLPLNVEKTQVDLISCCAHKIYGPKGIGALYIRRKPRVRVATQVHGGGQECGMRSGTLPVHQIVGMGEAFAIALEELTADYEHVSKLRDTFWYGIAKKQGIEINGDLKYLFPGILNIRFSQVMPETLSDALSQFAFSLGSACHSKNPEGSNVLRSLGLSNEMVRQSLRFSFGRFTTDEDIQKIVQAINSCH